jgi:1,4-alpha-glucan branching enzyme
MPGDDWQRFANLRLLYGYMWAHPGKKLLFMGGEFGQVREWSHEESLEWHVLQYPHHRGVQALIADLNRTYRGERALYEQDCEPQGFQWIDHQYWENSVIAFLRLARTANEAVLVVCNFTPVVRHDYALGVPCGGCWREILNSDASEYGGSGVGNAGGCEARHEARHGRPWSLQVTLPPLAAVWFKGTAA